MDQFFSLTNVEFSCHVQIIGNAFGVGVMNVSLTPVMEYDRWGGISLLNKTRLVLFDRNVNANPYINDVLRPVVLPFFRQHFQRGDGILQHDGARQHTAQITRNCLVQHAINGLDWPALSADMFPIEHVWNELKRCVYTRPRPPET